MRLARYAFAYRLALFTTLLTFVMIVWGGLVHNTGSSLACPDWPLCYDQIMPDTSEMTPEQQRGIFWEHGHRTLGTAIGLCAIGLCAMLWAPHPLRGSLRGRSFAVLALVVFQGVLGGITVHYKLPTAVSTLHLATSMIFFLLLIALSRKLAAWRSAEAPVKIPDPGEGRPAILSAKKLLCFTLTVVFAQIVLGALVRHLHASLSAGWGWQGAFVAMDPTTGNPTLWPSSWPSRLNMIHRYAAMITAAVVFICALRCWSLVGEKMSVHSAMLLMLPVGLVLFQILLGVLMLVFWTNMEIPARTAHLGGAAMLLAGVFLAYLRVGELLPANNK